jgi:MFS family permease
VLLTYGTLLLAGIQLSSIETVIPYIAEQSGSPGMVVALLVPGFTAGTLLGTALGPKVLHIAVSIAGLLGGIALFEAALTALIAVDVAIAPSRAAAYSLLLVCVLLGIVSGSSQVAWPMVLSTQLSARQRSDLLLKQPGFSAALVIMVTAFFASHFLRDVLPWHDAYLLWIAVALMVLCAACCPALRTRGVELAGRSERMLDTVRNGHRYLRTNPWLQRFLVTQVLFMSVTYSPMFYAIYAGESTGVGDGDMGDFIVFLGIGLLLGIPLWTAVRTRLGARGMYACSAAISVVAATFCIVSQNAHLLPVLWTLGFVLLLSAIASQAILPASYDWVFSHASAQEVVVVISYSQILSGLVAIFVSFAFSVAAGHGPHIWPLALLLALTVVAGMAATLVPRTAATA